MLTASGVSTSKARLTSATLCRKERSSPSRSKSLLGNRGQARLAHLQRRQKPWPHLIAQVRHAKNVHHPGPPPAAAPVAVKDASLLQLFHHRSGVSSHVAVTGLVEILPRREIVRTKPRMASQ
eukprot:scaffold34_cov260-Pinguiococcus_pyrenoidosus.AAC.33